MRANRVMTAFMWVFALYAAAMIPFALAFIVVVLWPVILVYLAGTLIYLGHEYFRSPRDATSSRIL